MSVELNKESKREEAATNSKPRFGATCWFRATARPWIRGMKEKEKKDTDL